jgi:glycosyltransferase involved in cell wall biosynthesis
MNNIHIMFTNVRFESRVYKITATLKSNSIASNVYIVGLHEKELPVSEEFSNGVVLHRIKLATRGFKSTLVYQLFKYIEYLVKLFKYSTKIRANILNIHSIDGLPIGVLLKYYCGARLIYDTHDLETERFGLVGTRKKISKYVEKLLVKRIDAIFVVSESIASYYENLYSIRKPTVIYNTPNHKTAPKYNIFREHFKIPDNHLIYLYQGGLSEGRGLKAIIEAFKETNKKDVSLVIMGYGPLEDSIRLASKEYENIFYHPAVSSDIVSRYTSSADVGFSVIENSCKSYYFCMPNKLFEYIHAGIPTIVSNMYDMSKFVVEKKVGFVVDEISGQSIKAIVERVSREDINQISKNLSSIAKEYSWETQEEKLIQDYGKFHVA